MPKIKSDTPKEERKEKKEKKEKKDKKEKKEKKVKADPIEEPVSQPEDQETASPSEPEASTSSVPPASAEVGTPPVEGEDGDLLEIDPNAPAPLSRAALRKSKSKSNLKEGEEPTTAASAPSTSKKAKDDSKAGKYSVWVGNLSFKTNEDQLKQYFSKALVNSTASLKGKGKKAEKKKEKDEGDSSDESESEAESEGESESEDEEESGEARITRIKMPRGPAGPGGRAGQNKGFAYVDFSNRESCLEAVKLSEGHLNGRALLIKLGSDFTNRPVAPTAAIASLPEGQSKSKTAQALLAKQKNPVGCTLFVGNLGFAATEDALRSLIESHWSTSLSTSKKHAQKTPRSKFLPEKSELEAAAAAAEGSDSEEPTSKSENKADAKDDEKVAEDISGAGLRKVRMGQFQDTGRCKGFAFLDFITPAQATAALIDMRNHRLDGRPLSIEFASAAAAARSGTGRNTFNTPIIDPNAIPVEGSSTEAVPQPQVPRKKVRPMKSERAALKAAAAAAAAGTDVPEGEDGRKRKGDEEGEEVVRPKRPAKMAKWEKAGRQRPGAALAMAKRENVGIVESQGTKVTFD